MPSKCPNTLLCHFSPYMQGKDVMTCNYLNGYTVHTWCLVFSLHVDADMHVISLPNELKNGQHDTLFDSSPW
jgi:hypothetical protein